MTCGVCVRVRFDDGGGKKRGRGRTHGVYDVSEAHGRGGGGDLRSCMCVCVWGCGLTMVRRQGQGQRPRLAHEGHELLRPLVLARRPPQRGPCR